jgi:hypothetical protein
MSRPIKEGDRVDICYADGSILTRVKVLNTPADVGDLWYFEDSGGTIYAQNPLSALFDYIRKNPVANEKAA